MLYVRSNTKPYFWFSEKTSAKSKLKVEALDVYFNLTSTSIQLMNMKVSCLVLEKRLLNQCNFFDWGIDNSFVCCPWYLHIYKLVYDIFEKLSHGFYVEILVAWASSLSQHMFHCMCVYTCLETQWSPSSRIQGRLGIVWCHVISFAWSNIKSHWRRIWATYCWHRFQRRACEEGRMGRLSEYKL